MPLAVFLLVWCAGGGLFALGAGYKSGLQPESSAGVLALSAALGILAAWRTLSLDNDWGFGWASRPWRQWPWAALLMGLVFGYAVWRAFFWLVYSEGRHLWISSPYNVGDLAFHWQLINYFAGGVPLWPPSPIFLEGPLRYPAGVNLFNALWVSAGVPLPQTLVGFGLAGGLVAAWALARWGGAWALAVFLFSGGVGGWMFFREGGACASAGLSDWKNLFLAVFVTQRGFLWALPAGLLLLWQWRARLEQRNPAVPHSVEVLLLGCMPLFHAHTFLFLVTVLLAAVVFGPLCAKKAFFFIGLAALPLALPLGWMVTGMGQSGDFLTPGLVGWQPGWLSDGTLLYWWWNFGLWLPVAMVVAGIFAHRVGVSRCDPAARVFVPVALLVLVLCFFFRFAPWAWDNVKLMAWAWLALAPWLGAWVFAPLRLPMRVVLVVLFFGGGAIELMCGLQPAHRYAWMERELLAEATVALRGLPKSSLRVAASPDVPHPVALLGFPVACGYPGHLWSHGYNYRDVENALAELLQDAKDSPLLEKVNAVWIGPIEKARFGGCPAWEQTAPAGWHRVWEGRQSVLFVRQDLAPEMESHAAERAGGLPDDAGR